MPRPSRRDEWDDDEYDREPRPRRKEQPSFAGTLMAAVGFGVTLVIGGVIGFAAGRTPREVEKPRSLEIAENSPPVTKPPVTPSPTPTPPKAAPKTPTPEPKKPEVKKPAPKPKKPEPKKPDPPKPEPKKPEPKKPDTPPAVMLVSFDKEILPIFKAKCNLCHGDAGNPKGDLDLRSLARAVRGGDNGPGAKAGKLDESTIWTRIEDGTMPPKEKMTDAEKTLIKNWILSGAK